MASETSCTVFVHNDKVPPLMQDVKQRLETGDLASRIQTMEEIVLLTVQGERTQPLLMSVIQHILPSPDHTLKKLLLMFLEVVDKKGPDGELLREMILICSKLINDLAHPNEYVRGVTLRFLCRLNEPELLEPLIPNLRLCLEHRHAYVRRNAILAVYSIYKTFDALLPDAPDLIRKMLERETDPSCQRNGFLMLYQSAQDHALDYLKVISPTIVEKSEPIQLVAVDLIRKVCRQQTPERSRHLRVIFELLGSSSASVQFEAASALISLSSSSAAVRAGTSAYISLFGSVTDNNVRLVVLDKLRELKKQHPKVLQDLVMDILRALSSPNQDIRRITLDIALDLITPHNVEEVVHVLKKEVNKTQNNQYDNDQAYRQMLIQAIHTCAVKFPDVAHSVVHVLMDFLGDSNTAGAIDVVAFVREVVETYPTLRPAIVQQLLETFHTIQSCKVLRAALWIVGEYCDTYDKDALEAEAALNSHTVELDPNAGFPTDLLASALETIKAAVGPLPLVPKDTDAEETGDAPPHDDNASIASGSVSMATLSRAGGTSTGPSVLADGTYATQTAHTVAPRGTTTATSGAGDAGSPKMNLRDKLLAGNFFLASVLASTLSKLVLRETKAAGDDVDAIGLARLHAAEAARIMASVIQLGHYFSKQRQRPAGSVATESAVDGASSAGIEGAPGTLGQQQMDTDSYERIQMCLRIVADQRTSEMAKNIFLRQCRYSFAEMLKDERNEREEEARLAQAEERVEVHADDLITFSQLRPKQHAAGTGASGALAMEIHDEAADLNRATGASSAEEQTLSARLARVHQLSGLSDPVYAEADVRVHAYDIVLDIFVANQTGDTLQNLALELATLGDLKLCERPQTYTLGPVDQRHITANIKVSSTETGIIFGNIVYDVAGAAASDKNCVVLDDIHIDIMDYISPASCSDAEFREMWAEYEWENKVAINTTYTDLDEFLAHIIKVTNMKCLTSDKQLSGECQFVAANLLAKSIFGENALCNVSIEKSQFSTIAGYIRIRSKTQGMALSLGDKITLQQNKPL